VIASSGSVGVANDFLLPVVGLGLLATQLLTRAPAPEVDSDRILEWDSRHGRLEVYDKGGNHLGEFDPNTGEQLKPPAPGRTIEP
jgi:hypothetical protein